MNQFNIKKTISAILVLTIIVIANQRPLRMLPVDSHPTGMPKPISLGEPYVNYCQAPYPTCTEFATAAMWKIEGHQDKVDYYEANIEISKVLIGQYEKCLEIDPQNHSCTRMKTEVTARKQIFLDEVPAHENEITSTTDFYFGPALNPEQKEKRNANQNEYSNRRNQMNW